MVDLRGKSACETIADAIAADLFARYLGVELLDLRPGFVEAFREKHKPALTLNRWNRSGQTTCSVRRMIVLVMPDTVRRSCA